MTFPAIRESQAPFSVPLSSIETGPLTNTGLTAGNPNMVADYSITPETFFREVQPGTCLHLTAINIYIRGGGAVGADKYATLAELTNGIEITITDDQGAIVPNLGALVIKTTGEFGAFGFTIDINALGGGDSYVNARFDTAIFKTAFVLPAGYKVNCKAQDNFAALTSHLVTIAGFTLASSTP